MNSAEADDRRPLLPIIAFMDTDADHHGNSMEIASHLAPREEFDDPKLPFYGYGLRLRLDPCSNDRERM